MILHFRLHTAYLGNEHARAIARGLRIDYNDKVFSFGKVWPHRETAFANADQLDRQKRQDYPSMVDRNPWTSMPELVRQLLVITGDPAAEGSAHRRNGR